MSLWSHIEHLYGDITVEEVVKRLKKDVAALRAWLIEFGGDCNGELFKEKARALREKTEELQKFETNINN